METERISGEGRTTHRVASTLLIAGLLFCIMLAISYYLAPSLMTLIEVRTGVFTTPEIVVRVYFTLLTAQVVLLLLLFLLLKPVNSLRERLLLYFLLGEGLVLSSVFLFEDPAILIRSEESVLTLLSSIVLILCATGAFTNLLMLRKKKDVRVGMIFWGLMSGAFLFAAIDESFTLHERLAALIQLGSIGQDLMTVLYAVGGFIVLAVFYRAFRNDLFSRNNWFFRLLLAALSVLGLAMFFDTTSHVFDYFFGTLFDVNHLCNSLEEVLEFTAACLFCCAFIVSIVEADENQILIKYESRKLSRRRSVAALLIGVLLFFPLMAGLVSIRVVYGTSARHMLLEDPYTVTVVADRTSGLNAPDGLLFHSEYGLIVCNEGSGALLAITPDGRCRPLVDANHGLVSPEGLATGAKGIFVSDDSTKKLLLYPGGGEDPVELYSDDLQSPEGLAIDQKGRLYVADETLSIVFRQTGNQRVILATSHDGLITPEELTFDESGILYLTDEKACAVFKISPEGDVSRFADKNDGLLRPEGITFHKGYLYVTDDLSGTIFRFDAEGCGEEFLKFGMRYRRLSGIAFDDKGDLYVVSRDPLSNDARLLRIHTGTDTGISSTAPIVDP